MSSSSPRDVTTRLQHCFACNSPTAATGIDPTPAATLVLIPDHAETTTVHLHDGPPPNHPRHFLPGADTDADTDTGTNTSIVDVADCPHCGEPLFFWITCASLTPTHGKWTRYATRLPPSDATFAAPPRPGELPAFPAVRITVVVSEWCPWSHAAFSTLHALALRRALFAELVVQNVTPRRRPRPPSHASLPVPRFQLELHSRAVYCTSPTHTFRAFKGQLVGLQVLGGSPDLDTASEALTDLLEHVLRFARPKPNSATLHVTL